MKPRIIDLPNTILVGLKVEMNYSNNLTSELWKRFMPMRAAIQHPLGSELYSVEQYDADFFLDFDPTKLFIKWAAVQVKHGSEQPDSLEILQIPAGPYAVFLYRGNSAGASEFYQQIFSNWLSVEGLMPDDRPHFAKMGEKYKNNHPDSEEEIWIPVKEKRF